MKKDLTQLSEIPQTEQYSSAEALISKAIDKNVPVESLERLLAMRRELKAEAAKEAFNKALTAFQAECPIIEKKKIIFEKDKISTRYKFAPLDSIIEQVKPLLSKHGFSHRFGTRQDEKTITAICIATHEMGHSENTEFTVPIGSEAFMTDVQKYGARLTFTKRYAFCNAFGIQVGDEDNDATTTQDTYKTREKLPEPEAKPHEDVYPITAFQIDKITKLLKSKDISEEKMDDVLTKFHVSEISKLSVSDANKIVEKFESLPTPKQDFKFKKPEGLELTDPI